ncbi:MAG: class I SAM-dependent methyltransferase, partial [Limnochordia bacterium]
TRFWDQFAPTYGKINDALRPLHEQVVELWQREGLINKDTHVLDIGCGPGTYGLPLAKLTAKVTALDEAPGMLATFMAQAEKDGMNNIEPVCLSWRPGLYHREFDFVLAADSPAIVDWATLEAMHKASRGYCCLIYSMGGGPSFRNDLWQSVMGYPLTKSPFDLSYPFNLIYRAGYYPEVRFISFEYIYRERPEIMFRNYQTYMEIFGQRGPHVDGILKEKIKGRTVGGLFEEKVLRRLGIMWWSVD